MALGKSVERTAKMCLRSWLEYVEMNKSATKFQGLFRIKQSKKNVDVLREKKRKIEMIIAMALGRSDLRWKKTVVAKLVVNRRCCKMQKRIKKCWFAFVAKTIAKRLIERMERRKKGMLMLLAGYRQGMLSVGIRRMQRFVLLTAKANQMQRVFSAILKNMRTKRVKLASHVGGSSLVALSVVSVSVRWCKARKINKCVKLYLWNQKMREIRMKAMRHGEIITKMTMERERRNMIVCKREWERLQLVWRKSYNCLIRGIRCLLARRELWRRREHNRLINVRLELKLNQRKGRIMDTVMKVFGELVIEKGLRELEQKQEAFRNSFVVENSGDGDGDGFTNGRGDIVDDDVGVSGTKPEVQESAFSSRTPSLSLSSPPSTNRKRPTMLPPIKQAAVLVPVDYISNKRGENRARVGKNCGVGRCRRRCRTPATAVVHKELTISQSAPNLKLKLYYLKINL